MTVLIKGPPPIQAVAKLKTIGAVQMYALLWESAYMDIRFDQRKGLPKEERRDCGGTSEWSIKGIADFLGLGRETVRKAMKVLLENGFISIDGLISTGTGSAKRVFRVTPPNELESRRYAIEIMGIDTLDPLRCRSTVEWNDSSVDQYSDTNFLHFLEDNYDSEFCGLWDGDFSTNVRDRLTAYRETLLSPNLNPVTAL